jgi:hypothetical protein
MKIDEQLLRRWVASKRDEIFELTRPEGEDELLEA